MGETKIIGELTISARNAIKAIERLIIRFMTSGRTTQGVREKKRRAIAVVGLQQCFGAPEGSENAGEYRGSINQRFIANVNIE